MEKYQWRAITVRMQYTLQVTKYGRKEKKSENWRTFFSSKTQKVVLSTFSVQEKPALNGIAPNSLSLWNPAMFPTSPQCSASSSCREPRGGQNEWAQPKDSEIQRKTETWLDVITSCRGWVVGWCCTASWLGTTEVPPTKEERRPCPVPLHPSLCLLTVTQKKTSHYARFCEMLNLRRE